MDDGGSLGDRHEPPFMVGIPVGDDDNHSVPRRVGRFGTRTLALVLIVGLAVALYWATRAVPGADDRDQRPATLATGTLSETDSLSEQYRDIPDLQVNLSSEALEDHLDYPSIYYQDGVDIDAFAYNLDRGSTQQYVITEEPTSERDWLLASLLVTVLIMVLIVAGLGSALRLRAPAPLGRLETGDGFGGGQYP